MTNEMGMATKPRPATKAKGTSRSHVTRKALQTKKGAEAIYFHDAHFQTEVICKNCGCKMHT